MRNSWLIAMRELKERIGARSFIVMSILGPLIILGVIYMLFSLGGEGKQHWNVLITDPANIMDNKILVTQDKSVNYSFAIDYIEMEDFRDSKQFQQFAVYGLLGLCG